MKFLLTPFIALIFLVSGCNEKSTPKPRGYFRIDFPEKEYALFSNTAPFSFEHPIYSKAIPDTSFLAEENWLNIEIDRYKAIIHISYKPVSDNLHSLTEDSRELAYKHSLKAVAINEQLFINPANNVYGTIYTIKGNAASPMQFHLTDSANHFLRGSFYISETPNYDSLSPVIDFLQKDIFNLIETFSWK